jgi:hypothetical protein
VSRKYPFLICIEPQPVGKHIELENAHVSLLVDDWMSPVVTPYAVEIVSHLTGAEALLMVLPRQVTTGAALVGLRVVVEMGLYVGNTRKMMSRIDVEHTSAISSSRLTRYSEESASGK